MVSPGKFVVGGGGTVDGVGVVVSWMVVGVVLGFGNNFALTATDTYSINSQLLCQHKVSRELVSLK